MVHLAACVVHRLTHLDAKYWWIILDNLNHIFCKLFPNADTKKCVDLHKKCWFLVEILRPSINFTAGFMALVQMCSVFKLKQILFILFFSLCKTTNQKHTGTWNQLRVQLGMLCLITALVIGTFSDAGLNVSCRLLSMSCEAQLVPRLTTHCSDHNTRGKSPCRGGFWRTFGYSESPAIILLILFHAAMFVKAWQVTRTVTSMSELMCNLLAVYKGLFFFNFMDRTKCTMEYLGNMNRRGMT